MDTKSVWMLLSRHMSAREGAGGGGAGTSTGARKQDFLGLSLYKGERAGRRIFYPALPPPWLQTALTNEPHVLLR